MHVELAGSGSGTHLGYLPPAELSLKIRPVRISRCCTGYKRYAAGRAAAGGDPQSAVCARRARGDPNSPQAGQRRHSYALGTSGCARSADQPSLLSPPSAGPAATGGSFFSGRGVLLLCQDLAKDALEADGEKLSREGWGCAAGRALMEKQCCVEVTLRRRGHRRMPPLPPLRPRLPDHCILPPARY